MAGDKSGFGFDGDVVNVVASASNSTLSLPVLADALETAPAAEKWDGEKAAKLASGGDSSFGLLIYAVITK